MESSEALGIGRELDGLLEVRDVCDFAFADGSCVYGTGLVAIFEGFACFGFDVRGLN
jgi:hypothetical protein